MSNETFLAKPTNRWSVFLLVLLACLALAAMLAGRAMKMKAEAAGPAQFLALKPGELAKVVFEVAAMPTENELAGTLLEKQDETHYRRTSTGLDIKISANTAIVMGARSDLHTRGVLDVTGVVEENHAIRANQLVVLSEYVTVR